MSQINKSLVDEILIENAVAAKWNGGFSDEVCPYCGDRYWMDANSGIRKIAPRGASYMRCKCAVCASEWLEQYEGCQIVKIKPITM